MGKEATKKHYEANTTKVLKSKVIARIKKGAVPQKSSLDKYDIDMDELNKIRKEQGFEPIEEVKEPRKRYKALTLDDVKGAYDSLVAEGKISEGTAHTHYTQMKNLLGESKLKEWYKAHHYTMLMDSKLNPNTASTQMAAVLNVLDIMPVLADKVGTTIHEDVKALFNELKVKKEQYNIDRQQNEDVESFDSILKRVEKDNDPMSEEVLLVNLYDNLTVRNDFGELSFDTDQPNHVDLDKGTITIKEFKKTNKKYSPIIDYKLNKKVLGLLKKHKELKGDGNVFKKQIRSIFKKAKVGIDLLRHSKISTELAGSKIKDSKKREDLRQKMLHSPMTQLTYVRKLKA